ncbi:MAG: hypothetical protein WA397_19905, partial [Roseiarcus sp.]
HLYVTSYTEGFSHFVTSMTAPVASGWSVCRVGLAPTGTRRLLTAHTNSGHSAATFQKAQSTPRAERNASGPKIAASAFPVGIDLGEVITEVSGRHRGYQHRLPAEHSLPTRAASAFQARRRTA